MLISRMIMYTLTFSKTVINDILCNCYSSNVKLDSYLMVISTIQTTWSR